MKACYKSQDTKVKKKKKKKKKARRSLPIGKSDIKGGSCAMLVKMGLGAALPFLDR